MIICFSIIKQLIFEYKLIVKASTKKVEEVKSPNTKWPKVLAGKGKQEE